jgi:hypothetical protein
MANLLAPSYRSLRRVLFCIFLWHSALLASNAQSLSPEATYIAHKLISSINLNIPFILEDRYSYTFPLLFRHHPQIGTHMLGKLHSSFCFFLLLCFPLCFAFFFSFELAVKLRAISVPSSNTNDVHLEACSRKKSSDYRHEN